MGSTASWPLSSTPTSSSTTQQAGSTGYSAVPQRLFGRALVRPFQRNAINDFASASGEERFIAALGQVLGTRCTSARAQGEVPWRPDFGSLLDQLRHRNPGPVTTELARQYVVDAVKKWIPSVRIINVSASREMTDNGERLVVNVSYAMVTNNTGQTLKEGVLKLPVSSSS